MTVNKVVRKLLKLPSLLSVTGIEFRNRNKELHLEVKPYKNGCRCPHCGRRGKIARFLEKRTWRDLVICDIPIYFHYIPKEIFCPTHGYIMEKIPWASHYSRMTSRLELQALTLTKKMTQKAVSELVKLPKSTLSDLILRYRQIGLNDQ